MTRAGGTPFWGPFIEWQWLVDQLDKYFKLRRGKKSTTLFFQKMLNRYLKKFKYPSMMQEDMKKKIKNWFRNRWNRQQTAETVVYIPPPGLRQVAVARKPKTRKVSKKAASKSLDKLLYGRRSKRMKTAPETYAELYNEEFHPALMEDWIQHKATVTATDKKVKAMTVLERQEFFGDEWLNHRQKFLSAEYKILPVGTKQFCENFRRQRAAQADTIEDAEELRKVAVRNLDKTIEVMLEKLSQETGYSFFLIGGGPDPNSDNDIGLVSSEMLGTDDSLPFCDYVEGYDVLIKGQYIKMLQANYKNYATQTPANDDEIQDSADNPVDDGDVPVVRKRLRKGRPPGTDADAVANANADSDTNVFQSKDVTKEKKHLRKGRRSESDANIDGDEALVTRQNADVDDGTLEERSKSDADMAARQMADMENCSPDEHDRYMFPPAEIQEAPEDVLSDVLSDGHVDVEESLSLPAEGQETYEEVLQRERQLMYEEYGDEASLVADVDAAESLIFEETYKEDLAEDYYAGPRPSDDELVTDSEIDMDDALDHLSEDEERPERVKIVRKMVANSIRQSRQRSSSVTTTISNEEDETRPDDVISRQLRKDIGLDSDEDDNIESSDSEGVMEDEENERVGSVGVDEGDVLDNDEEEEIMDNERISQLARCGTRALPNAKSKEIAEKIARTVQDVNDAQSIVNLINGMSSEDLNHIPNAEDLRGYLQSQQIGNVNDDYDPSRWMIQQANKYIAEYEKQFDTETPKKNNSRSSESPLPDALRQELTPVAVPDTPYYKTPTRNPQTTATGITPVQEVFNNRTNNSNVAVPGLSGFWSPLTDITYSDYAKTTHINPMQLLPQSSLSDTVPENAADTIRKKESEIPYVRKGVKFIEDMLGDCSKVLPQMWQDFEGLKGNKANNGKIQNIDNMPQKARIFRSHHSFTKLKANIPENPNVFGDEFEGWYKPMQGPWRLDKSLAVKSTVVVQEIMLYNDHNSMPDDANWDSMCVGGVDGFLLVIIGVAMWWQSAKKYGKGRKDTTRASMAVRDVVEVLDMMRAHLTKMAGEVGEVGDKTGTGKSSGKKRKVLDVDNLNGVKGKKARVGKENLRSATVQ